jgi:Ca2+-binding RTX toxin-like protein
MATLISGLGGTAGYGENTFSTASGRTGNLDDGSINVSLSSVFGASGINLYGTTYTSVFVNTNGLLTFGSAEPAYTSAALTTLGQPSVAPFWTDIDISKGGEIYWDLDASTGRLIVTWLNVAPYSGTGTNSFQAVLTNLGGGDVSIDYIYGSIGFVNGGFGNATVGISNGTSSQTLVEGSGVATFLATYAGNDFDTQDPAGIWSTAYEGGQPFLGDGVVEGTAGNDLIDLNYTADPEGDRIDRLDGTGFSGTTGDADYVLAGAGNDTVISGLANDIVYGGSGNDQISTGQGNDWADGGTEADSIDGGSGNDSLFGGAGDDTLFGGADSAAVTYTASYTEITTPTQAVTGSSGRPNFSVRSTSNETLTTGTNGTVSGFYLGDVNSVETHTHTASSQISGGQVLFNGVSGVETLTISIDGVTQNLTTAIANGTVTFNGAGLYQINGAGQIVRIGGGATSTTAGTLTINVPFTSLSLAGTGDTTSPGIWYEYYVNTQPNNAAAATGGNDVLSGGDGNDVLFGGNGQDDLYGDAGNDSLSGGDGADTLNGGLGADTLDGGADADILYGGDSNDSLIGGDGVDTLFGGSGADWLDGGIGNDVLNGEAGNDTLVGGLGNDQIFGGTENDVVQFANGWGSDTAQGGENTGDFDQLDFGVVTTNLTVTFTGSEAGTATDGTNTVAFTEFERITLGSGADLLNGAAAASMIQAEGGAGNDTLIGGSGNDSLYGGDGADSVSGGAGNDSLFGDAGHDTLQGGVGNDSLFGGDGNDLLIGGAGADSISGGFGNDTIVIGTGTDGFGDTVAGGENTGDFDVLDLTAWGWALTNVIYDLLNAENGTVQFLDSSGNVIGTMTFTGIEQVIPCFTPGTLISTERGEVAVEDLRLGDRVVTRDNGLQTLRWVGSKRLSLADLIVKPALRPVEIGAGALGHGLPTRAMTVSPQHRMVIEGARAEMLFGEPEVLVAATHLTSLPGVEVKLSAAVRYVHVMFDRHEIVCANGAWTESFQPAQRMLDGMDRAQADEVLALFPELAGQEFDFPAARLSLKAHEARVLLRG